MGPKDNRTWSQKYGNNAADEVADKGVAEHGDKLVKYAAYFPERHQQYKRLMSEVQKVIVAVLMAEKEPRRTRAYIERTTRGKTKGQTLGLVNPSWSSPPGETL